MPHETHQNGPDRHAELESRLTRWLGHGNWTMTPASSDASFRRYFRVHSDAASFIVMDAPPQHEDCKPFVRIAKHFFKLGLHVPEILQEDLEAGILLLSDLGDRLYLPELNDKTVQALYGDATQALLKLHVAPADKSLPGYDRNRLYQEISLFHEWFLSRYLGLQLSDGQLKLIHRIYDALIDIALEQPKVIVHRDFHSRNLMITPQNNPGIIDFQDAVVGAITYDLASLYRDCYITWPADQIYQWLNQYRLKLLQHGVLDQDDQPQFEYWFDFMGMQRQLKCVGIFSRLNIRDGKAGYLKDIPRTFNYIVEVLQRRKAFPEFAKFLHDIVTPAMQTASN